MAVDASQWPEENATGSMRRWMATNGQWVAMNSRWEHNCADFPVRPGRQSHIAIKWAALWGIRRRKAVEVTLEAREASLAPRGLRALSSGDLVSGLLNDLVIKLEAAVEIVQCLSENRYRWMGHQIAVVNRGTTESNKE